MADCQCPPCQVLRLLGINGTTDAKTAAAAVDHLTVALARLLAHADGEGLGQAIANIIEARNRIVRGFASEATSLANMEVVGRG